MGNLLGIAIRSRSRAPMEQREATEITRAAGAAGDRHHPRARKVTVIAREGWEVACAELGDDLPWTTRRANLLVEGVDLKKCAGAQLRVGEVLLEISEECDPCARMEEARAGLRRALEPDWRAGVLCSVLEEGTIRLGDSVRLEPAD